MTTKTKVNIAFGILAALFVTLAAIAACQPRPEKPAILATPAAELLPVGVPGNWTLTFQDEYDGTALSSAWYPCPIWYNCTQGGRTDQGVKAQAWFMGSQALVPGDGYLHLRAEKLTTPKTYDGLTFPYKSGYIITGKNSSGSQGTWFQYGYFETRMKCPDMPGSWCAFWLWGDHAGISMSYPNTSNEIDITENLTNNPYIQNMNLHGAASYSRTYRMSSVNSEWHTYAVDWQPGYVKWYVDGALAGTYTGTGLNGAWMYVIVSLQLGGTWAGSVDESKLPADMLVDYVRVWKTGSGSTVTPAPPTLTRTRTVAPSSTPSQIGTNTPVVTISQTYTRTPAPPTVTPVVSLTPTLHPPVTPYPTLGTGCYSLPGGGYLCVP